MIGTTGVPVDTAVAPYASQKDLQVHGKRTCSIKARKEQTFLGEFGGTVSTAAAEGLEHALKSCSHFSNVRMHPWCADANNCTLGQWHHTRLWRTVRRRPFTSPDKLTTHEVGSVRISRSDGPRYGIIIHKTRRHPSMLLHSFKSLDLSCFQGIDLAI